MCGDHHLLASLLWDILGSPPHVWGPRRIFLQNSPNVGITPACAGTTISLVSFSAFTRDHPRMCGDHYLLAPPCPLGKRITPACAGTTIGFNSPVCHLWDHPRMCGDHTGASPAFLLRLGSPPHVQGPPRCRQCNHGVCGITPACAGTTLIVLCSPFCNRDHPRMCGDHLRPNYANPLTMGSPPHVRGPLPARSSVNPSKGIECYIRRITHVRGPHKADSQNNNGGGITPHVRGPHASYIAFILILGSPACAGTTFIPPF